MAAASRTRSTLYVGLMSGTSLDGIDAALVDFARAPGHVIATAFTPYSSTIRTEALALNTPGENELERAAELSRELADAYADAVAALLAKAGISPDAIRAIGCHGQTVRHRPERGYTLQLGNGARLAERAQITVVDDFRSRDVAAGGQGAPLVPAFHQAWFDDGTTHRVIANLGGIANVTNLAPGAPVIGFDTGPANVLLDLHAARVLGTPVDRDGALAARGRVDEAALGAMLAEPFFALKPPRSTGRDLFNRAWLDGHLPSSLTPADAQATLAELTARSLVQAVVDYCGGIPDDLVLCGGGVHNLDLTERIARALPGSRTISSDLLGLDPDYVEAVAFAWLAFATINGMPGNLPGVTGAAGPRVLGAIRPA